MTHCQTFHDVGRLPAPGDNVAIATQRLPAETQIIYNDTLLTLDYSILEGHRFAIQPIHTEGGAVNQPNNLELVLRTLSGFLIHPNVGAVLAVDYGTEAITNTLVQQYMARHNYPLGDVLHHFLALQGRFQADIDQGAALIHSWLPQVNAMSRCEQSLSHMGISL